MGFIEGQNLLIAFRWAEGRYDRLRQLAADLVDLRVAILFAAGGSPSALAAKAATSTIPIVFSASNDPVSLGLVSSLNRPGGNVTGMSTFNWELAVGVDRAPKDRSHRLCPWLIRRFIDPQVLLSMSRWVLEVRFDQACVHG